MALRIKHSPVPISAVGNVTVLTGLDYQSTNSFEDPHNVSFWPPPCVILPSLPICLLSVHLACLLLLLVEDCQHGEDIEQAPDQMMWQFCMVSSVFTFRVAPERHLMQHLISALQEQK